MVGRMLMEITLEGIAAVIVALTGAFSASTTLGWKFFTRWEAREAEKDARRAMEARKTVAAKNRELRVEQRKNEELERQLADCLARQEAAS